MLGRLPQSAPFQPNLTPNSQANSHLKLSFGQKTYSQSGAKSTCGGQPLLLCAYQLAQGDGFHFRGKPVATCSRVNNHQFVELEID